MKELCFRTFSFCVLKDEEVMEYLKEVGPDTLMPCFSVNIKGNKSVELCNAVNTALFQSLRHTSDEHTAHRIPLIVTSSCKIPYKQSVAVSDFKKRLGVNLIVFLCYWFSCMLQILIIKSGFKTQKCTPFKHNEAGESLEVSIFLFFTVETWLLSTRSIPKILCFKSSTWYNSFFSFLFFSFLFYVIFFQ